MYHWLQGFLDTAMCLSDSGLSLARHYSCLVAQAEFDMTINLSASGLSVIWRCICLQVEFDTTMSLYAIQTKGRLDYPQWINNYWLRYTDNLAQWETYQDPYGTDKVFFSLSETRYSTPRRQGTSSLFCESFAIPVEGKIPCIMTPVEGMVPCIMPPVEGMIPCIRTSVEGSLPSTDVTKYLGGFSCFEFLISVWVFTVSKALLMSRATIIIWEWVFLIELWTELQKKFWIIFWEVITNLAKKIIQKNVKVKKV